MDAAHRELLLCVLLIAWGSCLQPAAAQVDPLASSPAARSSSLFVPVLDGDVAAASVSPQNLQISEKVVMSTATEPGAEPQPVMQVVELNLPLLTQGPRRLKLNLPGGATVTAIRRADLSRLASTVQVTPMTQRAAAASAEGGAALLWVGEVSTARRGLSSVVLVQSENGGLYGNIRYLDRRQGRIRTFKIFPMILEGADPVTAAAVPDLGPASVDSSEVSLAALYPNTHPTQHIVLEYEEAELTPPPPELEEKLLYDGPSETANPRPATVDTTPEGAPAAPEPSVVLSSDLSTLAASIAASAGPEVAAALGPEGFHAAAASALQALSPQAATAPPAPLAPVDDTPAATAAAAAYPNGTAVGGRRLQQSLNPAANTRQDLLVLYTQLAATRASGVTALETAVRSRVVETNKAYADSGAAIDLMLVGVRQVNYAQSTSTDLSAQLDAALTAMRANPAWLSTPRAELGADFVHLWIGTQSSTVRSGVCGLGYVPTSPTNVPALLSTLNNICFSSFGLAHEVGHNQGCFHATGDVGTKGPAYAAGWRRCDTTTRNFHTIMAYSCSGSLRAAYLSSPSITINGQAGGSATQGHCARRITETAASRAAVFAERFSGTVGALTSQVNSAKCIDSWKYVQGTQVAINDCISGRSYQRWEVTPDGRLQSPSTTRCMQVSATVTSGASVVQIWECSSTLSQQWFIDRLGRLHPYSTPARCLTLPSSTTTNGQGLTVTDCVNTAPAPLNQRWTASPAIFPAVFNPQNNRLQSRLAAAPQCIDNLAYNTTDGAAVVMMPCNSNVTTSINQRWSLTDAGQLQLMFNTAKCMTAVGTGGNGNLIRLFGCVSGGNNQRWFLDSLSRLRPYHAPTKCMDIAGASTAQQATLQLFDCLDANQQKWAVN